MNHFKKLFLSIIIPLLIGLMCIIIAKLFITEHFYSASFGIILTQLILIYGVSDAFFKLKKRIDSLEKSKQHRQ